MHGCAKLNGVKRWVNRLGTNFEATNGPLAEVEGLCRLRAPLPYEKSWIAPALGEPVDKIANKLMPNIPAIKSLTLNSRE